MSQDFSYRHLYYFWVVAKEGGMARAAERLGMAVQTVSTQVRELEKSLGHALLKPAGRGLALTEAGQAALAQADRIFALGEQLPTLVRDAAGAPVLRLALGVADGLPKLVARRLLEPVLHEGALRLKVVEGDFDELLAGLALHRLDLVLADRPAPANANLRLYTHALGRSDIAWYAAPALAARARAGFPQSLAELPVLLPGADSAVRVHLDQWFDRQGVRPRVVGEFGDSALLKTFGATGMGVFPAPVWVEDDVVGRYGVQPVGRAERVGEEFYAIGTERRVQHPLVQRVLAAAAPASAASA